MSRNTKIAIAVIAICAVVGFVCAFAPDLNPAINAIGKTVELLINHG